MQSVIIQVISSLKMVILSTLLPVINQIRWQKCLNADYFELCHKFAKLYSHLEHNNNLKCEIKHVFIAWSLTVCLVSRKLWESWETHCRQEKFQFSSLPFDIKLLLFYLGVHLWLWATQHIRRRVTNCTALANCSLAVCLFCRDYKYIIHYN